MRVLITGARAPACLEWARLLWKAGCTVAVADSVRFPLTRFSACVDRWFRLPAPVDGADAYGKALLDAAQSFGADCILPTCEEVFYIAHQKQRLEQQCPVFCADFGLLARLHAKDSFAEFSRLLPICAPRTIRLESSAALLSLSGVSRELVFKPVYSRFAARTLIRPDAVQLTTIQPTVIEPWIAQQFAAGRELCSYSLLRAGELLAHTCYHPKYRAGAGSGVYFEPVESVAIEDFAHAFGAATGYTGQVGFDFIESAGGSVSVLECNPRATGGIHLFHTQQAELAACLQSSQEPGNRPCVIKARGSPRMVGVAMALFAAPGLPSRRALRRFIGDWRRASDIVSDLSDPGPIPGQMVALAEIVYRSIRHRRSLLAATTRDIEWNGQDLGVRP